MSDSQQHTEVVCATCENAIPVMGLPGDLCSADGGVLLEPKYVSELPSDLLLGQIVGGSHAVFAQLGRGSMGSVYKAKHIKLGRIVAVKTIRPDGLSPDETDEIKGRFLREAKALSGLRHNGIVTVYDYGEHDNKLFMVLEFIRGESLWHRLARDGRLPVDRVVSMLRQLLEAMSEMHRIGIVHRDIKPSNVMLDMSSTDEERVVLIDFGVAKVARDDSLGDLAPITQMDVVVGTPKYMAPEQLLNEPLGPWTDIYAIGVMLYRMLSGKTPFSGRRADVVAAHLRDPAPLLPPELNLAAFDPVIAKAMHKDPNKRYRDATEFVSALIEGWVNATGNESVRVTQPLKIILAADLMAAPVQTTDTGRQNDRTQDDNGVISVPISSSDSEIERQEMLAAEASQSNWRGAVVAPPSEVLPSGRPSSRLKMVFGVAAVMGVSVMAYMEMQKTSAPQLPVVVTQLPTSNSPPSQVSTIKQPAPPIKVTPVQTYLGRAKASPIEKTPASATVSLGGDSQKRPNPTTVTLSPKPKPKPTAVVSPPPGQTAEEKSNQAKRERTTSKVKVSIQTKSPRVKRPRRRRSVRKRRQASARAKLRRRPTPKVRSKTKQPRARPPIREQSNPVAQKLSSLTNRFNKEVDGCNCSASKKTLAEIKRFGATPAKQLNKRYTMSCGIVGLGCLSREKKPDN